MVVKTMVPFFGSPTYYVPYYSKDPKRDHNFDNHPCKQTSYSDTVTRALTSDLSKEANPEGPGTLLLRNSGLKAMILLAFGKPKSLVIWYLHPIYT